MAFGGNIVVAVQGSALEPHPPWRCRTEHLSVVPFALASQVRLMHTMIQTLLAIHLRPCVQCLFGVQIHVDGVLSAG